MREALRMILVLSLICGLSGLTLAAVRQATGPRIEEQVLTFVQGPALQQIFTAADNHPVQDRVAVDLEGETVTVFPAMVDGRLTGVAFETFGRGYGGDIGVMVGFLVADDSLAGIGITTHKETPGLGSRVVEPEFREQFARRPGHDLALHSQGGDIAAVAGATFSSTATVAAINEAIRKYSRIKDRLPEHWGLQDTP
ncbi:FMN-binding protein [Pseudodesulfovibrio sp. F-1]|uniref:Ion-translocating oxidoreductase complex subunit G n=1 Tax=Pseudodesulfovibrio alkaliphilus TaxID=2661613 RepID=A0A7K1KM04_9BACT|nr:FMN-binding protein [Pseudodesulfovibrio alkaliphilus]MUM77037.1 FMN-binding protein [Pseudodesulfovibrio alkaliphilus]